MDRKLERRGLWPGLHSVITLSRFIPEGLEERDSLLFWRTKILAAMLLFGSVAGTAALVPVFFLALKEGLWHLMAWDAAMAGLAMMLLLGRNTPFTLRAGLTLGLVYLVGMVVIVNVGVISGGPAWLFAFGVLAGVLLGYKGAFLALGMNSLTLAGVGWLLVHGQWAWGVAQVTYFSGELVITAIVNFMLMNGAAALSVSVMVKGLVVSHERELQLTMTLQEKQKRLAGEIRGRHRADRARAESEERYRTILDSIEDGYFEVDLQGHISFFNGAMTRLVGVLEKDLPGMHHTAFMDEANAEKVSRAFKSSYETGENSQVMDCQILPRDGGVRDIEMVVSLMRNRQGGIVGFRGMARDVSARIALEKRLRQRSKMESIGTLAAGIAHDFNNVLYIIVGNADLALDDVSPGASVYQNLEQIKAAGLRAADIVKQLLSFSRDAEPHLVPLDLTSLVDEEVRFMRSTFPAWVEIIPELSTEAVPVLGDRVQLKQMMINLFTNAVQAMEGRSGRIQVVLSRGPGQNASLVIQDTGPGIRQENLDRIFDPYFTTKEVGQGTGMGLSVVHSIVERHQGHIDVSSREGHGARFEVVLPLTGMPLPEKLKEAGAPAGAPLGTEAILVVDDEPMVVDTNTKALARLGYRVRGFRDPLRAWEIFSSDPHAWDLVITDMTMPAMTGQILARNIRNLNKKIPILICTGYNTLPNLNPSSGMSEGIRLLQKPVTLEKLGETVRKALDRNGYLGENR